MVADLASSDLTLVLDGPVLQDASCSSMTSHTQLYLDNLCPGGGEYCLGTMSGA
jgi:hypothetical protein